LNNNGHSTGNQAWASQDANSNWEMADAPDNTSSTLPGNLNLKTDKFPAPASQPPEVVKPGAPVFLAS